MNRYNGYYNSAKRSFDVIVSIFLMVTLIPLWAIVASIIKLENPKGSILYRQNRVGINGKKFVMYKFRTMVVDADEMRNELESQNEKVGPLFKMKRDPRITKIGKFLRKTSLDEFPQLFNVLRGEMSLIGPRPSLPEEFAQFSEFQKQRISVKPGCTGLWQVSGRSNLSFSQMISLDLEYIDRFGFLMDLKIFIKTLKVLITGEGAY